MYVLLERQYTLPGLLLTCKAVGALQYTVPIANTACAMAKREKPLIVVPAAWTADTALAAYRPDETFTFAEAWPNKELYAELMASTDWTAAVGLPCVLFPTTPWKIVRNTGAKSGWVKYSVDAFAVALLNIERQSDAVMAVNCFPTASDAQYGSTLA